MYCDQCGVLATPTAIFCRSCGHNLLASGQKPGVSGRAKETTAAVCLSMYCDQCGALATPTARFCRGCGHSLPASMQVAEGAGRPKETTAVITPRAVDKISPPIFGLPQSPHVEVIARPVERRTETIKPDRDGATDRDRHGRWSVKHRSWILVGAILCAVVFLLTFFGIGQVPRQAAEPSADKNQNQLEKNAVVKSESAERQSLPEARTPGPSEPTDVAGQYKLALNFLQGSGGFEKSDAQAAKWFRKSADQGYALAQNSLGFMYEKGRGGLARDDVRAVHWYEKAADQGLALAQNNLGRMYLEGRGGLAKDETLASAWFRKSANQGDALGQVFLGGMYEEGRGGLAKSDAQAAKWFRKAADQGYPLGQYSLGVMYREGRGGLAKNKAQAAKWFKRAADQGYAPARIALAKIKE